MLFVPKFPNRRWWVNLCGATSGPEASRPTPGHKLLFVLHIPLPTPGKADSSMQNDGLSMQNDGLSMQNGTADRSFCTRVQNGNMIRNRLILRLAVHDVKHWRTVQNDPLPNRHFACVVKQD